MRRNIYPENEVRCRGPENRIGRKEKERKKNRKKNFALPFKKGSSQ